MTSSAFALQTAGKKEKETIYSVHRKRGGARRGNKWWNSENMVLRKSYEYRWIHHCDMMNRILWKRDQQNWLLIECRKTGIRQGDEMDYIEIDGHKLHLFKDGNERKPKLVFCPVPERSLQFMISRFYMKNWSAISESLWSRNSVTAVPIYTKHHVISTP